MRKKFLTSSLSKKIENFGNRKMKNRNLLKFLAWWRQVAGFGDNIQ